MEDQSKMADEGGGGRKPSIKRYVESDKLNSKKTILLVQLILSRRVCKYILQ